MKLPETQRVKVIWWLVTAVQLVVVLAFALR